LFTQLLGVSCVSGTSCFAVGVGVGNTLVEQWNGTAWSIVASADPAGYSFLYGVACTSSTSCQAVGTTDDKTKLIEQWNGTSWSIVPSPSPSGPSNARLLGVSCPTTTSCFAVGDRVTLAVVFHTLCDSWVGSAWSV